MPAEQSSIQRYYDRKYQGAGPARATEATLERRIQAARDRLGPPPRRILDYGCGRGDAVRAFAEAGHEVVGVDIAEGAVEFARQNVPGADFHVVTPEARLPFPDGSFDVCFSSEVIEHVFDVRAYVQEVNRVLRDGGRLLLTTPYHGLMKNVAVAAFAFERHFHIYGGHIRFFSRKSIAVALDAGGFDVLSVKGIGRSWPFFKTMFVEARKRPSN